MIGPRIEIEDEKFVVLGNVAIPQKPEDRMDDEQLEAYQKRLAADMYVSFNGRYLFLKHIEDAKIALPKLREKND